MATPLLAIFEAWRDVAPKMIILPALPKPFALSGRYMAQQQYGAAISFCVWDKVERCAIRPLMALSFEAATAEARELNRAWRDDA